MNHETTTLWLARQRLPLADTVGPKWGNTEPNAPIELDARRLNEKPTHTHLEQFAACILSSESSHHHSSPQGTGESSSTSKGHSQTRPRPLPLQLLLTHATDTPRPTSHHYCKVKKCRILSSFPPPQNRRHIPSLLTVVTVHTVRPCSRPDWRSLTSCRILFTLFHSCNQVKGGDPREVRKDGRLLLARGSRAQGQGRPRVRTLPFMYRAPQV